jgi:F-type H+-transporting ATPase subunit gamma
MAGAKEIRGKIRSVQSTQKITRAMEMVAASKMRRAQQRMLLSRPYAVRIQAVIDRMTQGGHLESRHPYAEQRPEQHAGLIVMSSDRGLCGGLNINLFRSIVQHIEQKKAQNIPTHLMIFGSKGESFFKRFGAPIEGCQTKLGDAPTVKQVMGAARLMLQAYREKRVDSISVAYNSFESTMHQKPVIQRVLPIVFQPTERGWDYLYEPNPLVLLDLLFERYLESQLYHAMVENFACEQAARMVAMQNASNNAGDFVSHLQLAYNKARQAAITQELAEIVSGAAAV